MKRLLAAIGIAAWILNCGRPPDEAWLRLVAFRSPGTSTPLTVLNGALLSSSADVVDVALENQSQGVSGESGTGILVLRARVEYAMAGHSPPPSEQALHLYLAAPAASAVTSGTVASLSVAPVALKTWLADTGAFDDAAAVPVVSLTARVTLFAETDEGGDLEIGGALAVALANSSTAPEPPAGPCLCTGNLYNCEFTDFASKKDAQACYDYCISQGAGDVHVLDADNDGEACDEGLR